MPVEVARNPSAIGDRPAPRPATYVLPLGPPGPKSQYGQAEAGGEDTMDFFDRVDE